VDEVEHIDEVLAEIEHTRSHYSEQWPFTLAFGISIFLLGACLGGGFVAVAAWLAGAYS
jgi:hypothetical protein